ncbi:hypothetical protein [Kitasatospora sp. KL5]|uniref:hypothetical protein n=1 Tax=Kitasatospora sp. KL5 TaxID=3425125 RepID=UPI003D6E2E7A
MPVFETVRRAAAAGAVLLLGCVACGAPPDPFGVRSQPRATASDAVPSADPPSVAAPLPSGRPLGPDSPITPPPAGGRQDPTAVALAWAATAYGYDTAYDISPHDALLRAAAAGLLDDRLAGQEREYAPRAGAGADWLGWSRHRAWTEAGAVLGTEEHSPDTERSAQRQLLVDGTAHGRDGWNGPGPKAAVFLTLERGADGHWRISQIESTPM